MLNIDTNLLWKLKTRNDAKKMSAEDYTQIFRFTACIHLNNKQFTWIQVSLHNGLTKCK